MPQLGYSSPIKVLENEPATLDDPRVGPADPPRPQTAQVNLLRRIAGELSTVNVLRFLGPFQTLVPKRVALQARVVRRRNQLYVKSEKLRALLAGHAKRILFVGKPEWAEEIQRGFNRLPHQIEFGPVTDDNFGRYDLVVPLSISALEEVRRSSTRHKIAFPLPPEESVRLCNDKFAFNQALVAAGFGAYIPRFAQGPELKPPYILKKRTGSWGLDCFLILNEDDRKAHLNRIADPEFFCQEFIPGPTEFATHILFLGGKIIKALNVRYTFARDTPIKGQEAVVLQGVHRCSHLDLFTEILRAIRYEGLCCVNYKISNGELYLLEINPRFGGSLAPYFFSFIRHLH